MKDTISVIIPIYKVEPYLRQCLDSVVNQTYRNLEIILIDDGSPDNCGKICDEYVERDDRIIVIHKENGGLSAAWNDGIEKARGEWISFIDSDDWVDCDYFSNMLIENSCNADVIIANGFIEESVNGQQQQTAFLNPFVFYRGEGKDYLRIKTIIGEKKEGMRGRFVYAWNKLYRTAFLKNERFRFDEDIRAGLANDGLFNFLVFEKAATVCGVINISYHYRKIATSGTLKYGPDRPEMQHYVLQRMFNEITPETAASVRAALEAYSLTSIDGNLKNCYFHPDNTKSYSKVCKDIKNMKKMHYYYLAIHAGKNPYLSSKQKVMKFALQMPFIWPLKLLHDMNEMIKKAG